MHLTYVLQILLHVILRLLPRLVQIRVCFWAKPRVDLSKGEATREREKAARTDITPHTLKAHKAASDAHSSVRHSCTLLALAYKTNTRSLTYLASGARGVISREVAVHLIGPLHFLSFYNESALVKLAIN